jgi:HSP20 family molecular chaperone IbpA
LSDDTDKENISATCDKGLLTITVPKKKDKQRRRIEVE